MELISLDILNASSFSKRDLDRVIETAKAAHRLQAENAKLRERYEALINDTAYLVNNVELGDFAFNAWDEATKEHRAILAEIDGGAQ